MANNVIRQPLGYVLVGSCNTTSPADSTTYYFGDIPVLSLQTSADIQRIYFPKAGRLKAVRVTFHQTVGSAETSSVYFRLNNTTDTTISDAVVNNAVNTTYLLSALSTPVTTNDYFEIKWVTPAWVTNPTNVRVSVHAYVE